MKKFPVGTKVIDTRVGYIDDLNRVATVVGHEKDASYTKVRFEYGSRTVERLRSSYLQKMPKGELFKVGERVIATYNHFQEEGVVTKNEWNNGIFMTSIKNDHGAIFIQSSSRLKRAPVKINPLPPLEPKPPEELWVVVQTWTLHPEALVFGPYPSAEAAKAAILKAHEEDLRPAKAFQYGHTRNLQMFKLREKL